jgi:hypothetical protein
LRIRQVRSGISRVWAVESPLRRAHVARLQEIQSRLGIPFLSGELLIDVVGAGAPLGSAARRTTWNFLPEGQIIMPRNDIRGTVRYQTRRTKLVIS